MEKGFGSNKTEKVDFKIDGHSFDQKWSASQGRPLDGNEIGLSEVVSYKGEEALKSALLGSRSIRHSCTF